MAGYRDFQLRSVFQPAVWETKNAEVPHEFYREQSSAVICCWPLPAQSFLVSGPAGPETIFLFVPRPLMFFLMGPPHRREEGSHCCYRLLPTATDCHRLLPTATDRRVFSFFCFLSRTQQRTPKYMKAGPYSCKNMLYSLMLKRCKNTAVKTFDVNRILNFQSSFHLHDHALIS
jgi:hypothetical protein